MRNCILKSLRITIVLHYFSRPWFEGIIWKDCSITAFRWPKSFWDPYVRFKMIGLQMYTGIWEHLLNVLLGIWTFACWSTPKVICSIVYFPCYLVYTFGTIIMKYTIVLFQRKLLWLSLTLLTRRIRKSAYTSYHDDAKI